MNFTDIGAAIDDAISRGRRVLRRHAQPHAICNGPGFHYARLELFGQRVLIGRFELVRFAGLPFLLFEERRGETAQPWADETVISPASIYRMTALTAQQVCGDDDIPF